MNPGDLDLSSLQQVLSSMKKEDLDALKEVAADLFQNDTSAPKEAPPPPKESALPFDLASIGKITTLLSALNGEKTDPRSDLLLALRPMLKEERRHRVDQAAQMLKLIALLPKLRELGL